jgi:8-hydroxy-5-deazaflavin:NADPH oxidoreductase
MTKLAILGTGIVGQTLAARLQELGNEVMIGTRNVESTLAKTENDAMGFPPFKDWYQKNDDVQLGTFAQAASFGEMIFNCTNGHISLEVLKSAGEKNLKDKILIDVSNPLDFSNGFPPFLFVCNTDSLGEQIQNAFPLVKVVKTLNTMNAFLMVEPSKLAGSHHVFMSGNDAEAKASVKSILNSFGWLDKNIMDMGDITTARGTEMMLPMWIRLYGTLNNPMFNFHINTGL